MTSIANLGVSLGEALRAEDTLAAAQILADARAFGGRLAVLGVLDCACVWAWRTGPRGSHQPPDSVPADSPTAARSRHTDVSDVRGRA